MPAAGRLARLGLWLRQHRGRIIALQWLVVLVYFALLIVPVLQPLPPESAHIYDNLRLFAQFVFWGLWWPGVMLATVGLGRVWCGVLCPEGALSEWASRFGRGKALPGWLKWSGWPFVAFVCTTVYGQLVSVYEYPQAALLVLGGSTVAAVAVGLLYGREKRIWCRYLCPASGVFAVLARIAPVHFRVDRARWDAAQGVQASFNCPPLVDVRRMTSSGECHSCGRCAGQRDAVSLSLRSPFAEALDPQQQPFRTADAVTLLFGVLGVASAAFQWTVSPYFLHAKLWLADWLVEHDLLAWLDNDAPWWLLTHYPEASDLFTWLDGGLILFYLLVGGGVFGALLGFGPWLASRLLAKAVQPISWQRLTLTLTPLAAASVVLGLSMLTVSHLKAEHVDLSWLPVARLALFGLGALASLRLAVGVTRQAGAGALRTLLAVLCLSSSSALLGFNWYQVFFAW